MSYNDFKFNSTYADRNTDYITVPPMTKFCRENNLKTVNTFEEHKEIIQNFARKNIENFNKVLEWGEKVLKQGIKQLHVTQLIISEPILSILKEAESCSKFLGEKFNECPMSYLLDCSHFTDIKLQRYQLFIDEYNNQVNSISFYFDINLIEGVIGDLGTPTIYPVFVDLDLERNLLIVRAKSKTQIFYKTAEYELLEENRTDIKKIIESTMSVITEHIPIAFVDRRTISTQHKNAIYNFLETMAFTPKVIRDEIDNYEDEINDFIENFFHTKGIEQGFFDKAKEDLEIIIEKYLSISCDDQSIFTDDRSGYPIEIATTDHEKSRMKESSSARTPLQTKELFFDNKKSMQTQKSCDSLKICYDRINTTYYGKEPFVVVLDTDGSFLRLSFREYVEEEDIQNVLHKIIELEEA